MPGRVTTFLRNPSGNIAHIKKATANANRSRHASSSPEISDGEDAEHHRHGLHHAVKMPDLADAVLKANRRLSLPFGKKEPQCTAVSLDWNMESPPIIFHGNAEESTGALLSGQMVVDVKEESIELDSFQASLSIHVVHKRPFQNHCHDCANQVTELKSWRFLAHPTVLHRGKHLFPFSTLLDGHLPGSMSSSLMAISYDFKAEARIAPHTTTSHSHVAKFDREIPIKRSLRQPEVPHHSVRLFPPTNIKASSHYDTTIHPTGTNTVTLKLDGLMSLNEKTKTLDIWRLKKITWKLEEVTKTVAPACPKHQPLVQASSEDDEPKKGIPRNEVRLLGEKHIHGGWKSDYSGTDGTVDFEFEYAPNQRRSKGGLKYACDSKSRDGTNTTHTLLIELVVSKEFAPEGRPNQAAHTGTGRILRMNFNVVLTDHPGLGISWDEEAPPTYQNVPPSPPRYYLDMAVEDAPLIEYEDLECLEATRESGAPPSRRPSGSA